MIDFDFVDADNTQDPSDRLALAAHVAARVRSRRLALGMTQIELGRRVGVTRKVVTDNESATRANWPLIAIAKAALALGCTLEDLVGGFDLTQLACAAPVTTAPGTLAAPAKPAFLVFED